MIYMMTLIFIKSAFTRAKAVPTLLFTQTQFEPGLSLQD